MRYLFLLLLLSNLSFAQLRYITKANISSLTDEMGEHRMSVQGNNIYVCYKRGIGTSIEDREIKVSISTNKGLSWNEKDITITNNTTFSPVIISTHSVILVLYKYIDSDNQTATCIARSTNNGESFSLSSSSNKNLPFVVNSVYCDIATSEDGKIYIGDDGNLFLSQDDGMSFTQLNEPYNFSKAYRVTLNANNNNFWVTFNGGDSIYCYVSNDFGNSYQLISKFFADFSYGSIATCQKNDNLAILWNEEIVGVNYLRIRVINAVSIGSINNIATASTSFDFLGLEWGKNNIWVSAYGGNNYELFYSTNSGTAWSLGSKINTETQKGLTYYGNNFYCYDDTTLFFLGEASSSGSLKEYIFLNIKWADFPSSELNNDTLLTYQTLTFIVFPYISTSKYRIQISNTSNFNNILVDTTTNSNYFSANIKNRLIANQTKYYYRLRGEDESYLTSWSPNKTFIYGHKIDAVPILILPNNNYVASWPDYVDFQWSVIPVADSYEIHLSSKNDFSDTLHFYGYPQAYFFTNSNKFTGAVMYTGDIYWRVRGFEESTGSFGRWSNSGNIHYTFVTDVKDVIDIPKNFALNNYPNPFNPSTNIVFGIPAQNSEVITIAIYNILGEKLTELLSERKSPGWYKKIWDASNFPSGIYLCIITDGKHRLLHKLSFIK